MNDDQEATLREIVGRVAGKWTLWTLHILNQTEGPLRFAQLLERVDGISQKILTQTLCGLERDGLVTRTVFPEVPPHVECAPTELGRDTMKQFTSFRAWIASQLPNIESTRSNLDGKSPNRKTDG